MFNPLILIYCIVVLAFFLLFMGLSTMFGGENRTPERLRRKRLADGLSPWLAQILITQRVRDFEVLCVSSGIPNSPMQVLSGMAISTLVVMLVMNFIKFGPLYCMAAGLFLGVALPLLVIRAVRRRRMIKLTRQLPDALDMIVRSLRVGHPVSIGIGMIGSEMPDPIGGEFRRLSQRMSYGLDLRDAFEDLSARLDVPDVRYMIAAIRIQTVTGGNLSEVLASLSTVMRERVRLAMKVRALSSETRFSGNVMALLPFVMVAGMFFLRPDFYKEVPGNPLLQEIIAGAGILLAIGILMMRRIVNIRA